MSLLQVTPMSLPCNEYNNCVLILQQGNHKGKKKGQAKNNIKQAPFHIHDGDTVGVKVKQLHNKYILAGMFVS